MRRIFLDYNSTNQPDPQILDVIREEMSLPLNPSSVHYYGQLAKQKFTQISEDLASVLGVHPLDLIFVSGATEANHLGVLGSLHACESKKHNGVIYFSVTGHPSLVKLRTRCEQQGFKVQMLPVVSRQKTVLDVEFAAAAFQKNPPLLVAFEWVNNEFGVIQPVDQLCELARSYGARVHVDAVQAFGRIPTAVANFPDASFSFSGHKYAGMGGHGLLVKPRKFQLEPQIVGGSQQAGMRAGTIPLMLVKAQGWCMKHYQDTMVQRVKHVSMLRELLEGKLKDMFREKHPGEILGVGVDRIPNTTLFRFVGVNAETLNIYLDLHGFMTSTGSACSSGGIDPSSGLLQMGIDGMEAAEFLRVSTSEKNTAEEIQSFLDQLNKFVATCH